MLRIYLLKPCFQVGNPYSLLIAIVREPLTWFSLISILSKGLDCIQIYFFNSYFPDIQIVKRITLLLITI